MNRERAKQLLPMIQAFADGKEIQGRSVNFPEWGSVASQTTFFDSFEYRIKPEPREWWIDLPERLVYEQANPPYPNAIKVREVIE